ncbi:MAG TPA: BNR repeat-containing protein, partial [Paludibacter sp.]|nr:BNR repeat-containing protein [Paludibacter sp.]
MQDKISIYEGNVISPEGAWCWFADPRALHYENAGGTINSTYVGYIDVHGNIKATQQNFLTGKNSEVLIRSYFQPDDHDNPSFLVLPDERVMIFYSRHTDEACFYYRISRKPGDITTLGDEKKIITANNTTYPSPFIMSDDPTHIYLCWRGINWHPTIARLTMPDASDNVNFDWGPYQMVQSTGARPYCKYFSNGKDRIYLTYTTGHPDNEYPNWVYFNYVDVNTKQLKDIAGTTLSTIANGVHNVNRTNYNSTYPKAVVDMPTTQRDWVWQTTMDTDGNPVIAMVQISNDKGTHNYYYAKWTGTTWRKTFLANGGGKFHQTAGLELCYSGGMAIDDANPNTVYCSVPVVGTSGTVYEIMKYVVGTDGTVTSSQAITSNSTL